MEKAMNAHNEIYNEIEDDKLTLADFIELTQDHMIDFEEYMLRQAFDEDVEMRTYKRWLTTFNSFVKRANA